ncbi:hypothetical protein PR048_016703 [Dryococelus australis]|uniref:DDE Tnp4 domain-containing protein n=1 Tax=Dryococelus australis TaxID=614101 RepID=A0ABQ9H7J1_9NEOP|nr:hypothetical protein PR048_016703 [Dryococelus australis]
MTKIGKNFSEGFHRRWNFLHSLGCVDCIHVCIKPPPNSGPFYFNYKGLNSLVTLATVNAE